jgi:ABC-type glycerol-3-phosphate transport system permease component
MKGPRKGGRPFERAARRVAGLAALVAAAVVCGLPFVWMVLATFKDNPEVFRPLPLMPERFSFGHYRALLDGTWIPFPRQLLNSLLASSLQAVGALLLSVPAGFVLARYRFRGARALLTMGLLGVLVPPPVMALPLFAWLHRLGLVDTLAAIVLPGLASGLGLVYFTLVFRHVPEELCDLARSEGASEPRVFLTLLPMVRSQVAAFGLVLFVLAWHEHLLPLMVLGAPEARTVPVGLASLYGSATRLPYALLMVGGLLGVIPVALLFLALRRHLASALSELVAR